MMRVGPVAETELRFKGDRVLLLASPFRVGIIVEANHDLRIARLELQTGGEMWVRYDEIEVIEKAQATAPSSAVVEIENKQRF